MTCGFYVRVRHPGLAYSPYSDDDDADGKEDTEDGYRDDHLQISIRAAVYLTEFASCIRQTPVVMEIMFVTAFTW